MVVIQFDQFEVSKNGQWIKIGSLKSEIIVKLRIFLPESNLNLDNFFKLLKGSFLNSNLVNSNDQSLVTKLN